MTVDMGMAVTARQEGFGDAFLLAVAAAAGCAVARRRPDDDSIDWTLSCRLPKRPKLDVQMKTVMSAPNVIRDVHGARTLQYPLKKKNYDDLILENLLAPRILVLVILPDDIGDWVLMTEDGMLMRKCMYWVSLAGMQGSQNKSTVTVSVPEGNRLTPESLQGLMMRISGGDWP